MKNLIYHNPAVQRARAYILQQLETELGEIDLMTEAAIRIAIDKALVDLVTEVVRNERDPLLSLNSKD